MAQDSVTQDSLIVVTRVRTDKDDMVDRLRAVLADIGKDPASNRWMPFGECRTVHYARWAFLPASTDAAGKTTAPQLVFATDFDLPLECHLKELVREGRKGLDRVYECCEGYPGTGTSDARVVAYLLQHRVVPEARYQGARFRSRAQIDGEAHLRAEIENFIDDQLARNGNGASTSRTLVDAVMSHVRGNAKTRELLEPPPSPGVMWWLRYVADSAWRGLKELPEMVNVLLSLRPLFRDEAERAAAWKMKSQAEIDAQIKAHLRNEDENLQNEMTLVTNIRDNPLWRSWLQVVLTAIELRCRFWDVNGRLGRQIGKPHSGVPTIHFCQWVVIDEGRRLLFLTNYDGSFERYLDDFVDFNAPGVSGIWGSSEGYPPTKSLVCLQATSREIKAFFRTNQVETAVWYGAYSRLAVTEINKTSALRAAVAAPECGRDPDAVLGGL